jgi:hypothetical protein
LVGDKDSVVACLRQALEGLEASGQKLKFRPALDIVGRVAVDDPVAIQKNDFSGIQRHGPFSGRQSAMGVRKAQVYAIAHYSELESFRVNSKSKGMDSIYL